MNPFKPGSILVCRWGWEQTNIDFYMVVSTSNTMATLQQVVSVQIPTGDMTYEAMPNTSQTVGEPFRRKVKSCTAKGIEPFCKIEDYASAREWDGKPKHGSSYA